MTDTQFTVLDDTVNSRYVLVSTPASSSDALPQDSAETAVSHSQVVGLIDYLDTDFGSEQDRILYHTEVDPQYSGQGLASILVQGAVDDVIAQGKRIVPVCPYVHGWLPKHPEYLAHTTEPHTSHLEALQANMH